VFQGNVWTAGKNIDADTVVWEVSYSNGTVVQLPMVYTNWYSNVGPGGYLYMCFTCNWKWSTHSGYLFYFLCEIP